MLVDHVEKVLIGTIGTIKHFSFPVQYELLKIKRNSFSNTEILGILRHAHFHFIANAEEMINGVSARENYGCIMANVDLLLPKILGRDAVDNYKWVKIKGYVMFPGQIKVWRFFSFRLGLGNKYFLNRFG